MEFQHISQFLDYFEKVRKRTHRVIACIPPDKIEWTYRPGKFTLGDLIRHLANIERDMYAENAQFKPSLYKGCGIEYAEGFEGVKAFLDAKHAESVAIFERLTPGDLLRKTRTPGDTPITLWKWLRLMAEHEIHHRGQIYLYLTMLGVDTPPLYGMTAEQVAGRAGG